MTALDHSALGMPSTKPAFWDRFARRVLDVARLWNNRQAIIKLSEMSDRELADVGLVRSDLGFAQSAAFGEETARLADLVSDRRSRQEAARRIC